MFVIILGDGYYGLARANVTTVDGVLLLSTPLIISFKMYVRVDNHRLHDEGVWISWKVLRKHCADVVELAGLFPANVRFELGGGAASKG